MYTQAKGVDVSDRVLAATFDQYPGNIAASNLEQLCAEKSERTPRVNHYAKRAYEFLLVMPSLALATLACFMGIIAIKSEDAYQAVSGKDKPSRILASPFFVKKIFMPDNSWHYQVKIRTMMPDANSHYPQMVEQGYVRPGDEKSVASDETALSDPRVTAVGKVLREHSADEAPQVFQWICQYLGKGWLYSPNNLYFFGNRPQSPEAIEHASPEKRRKLREGPFGLVGLDCIGRGMPDHGKEADNNHKYSVEFRNQFILPTDLRIGKGLLKAVVKGSNS
jgi:lipopolysaccharide/colanic/teichoic acid biosynthesis glycosyltransferase